MNPFRLTTRLQPPPRALRRVAMRAEPEGSEAAIAATTVPWRVASRSDLGVIDVEHCGATPLHSVRFALAGQGMLGLSLPRTVYPAERVRVVVRGSQADRAASSADAMLVLRWFQPDGTELLWPIAL